MEQALEENVRSGRILGNLWSENQSLKMNGPGWLFLQADLLCERWVAATIGIQRQGRNLDIHLSPTICGLLGVRTHVLLYTVLTEVQGERLCISVLKSSLKKRIFNIGVLLISNVVLKSPPLIWRLKLKICCYGLNIHDFQPPDQSLHVETPTPNVMVFRDVAFWR